MELKPSWIILFLSGALILIGLPFVASGSFIFGVGAKVLYGLGVLLFVFDK